jgi:hypothetical protein
VAYSIPVSFPVVDLRAIYRQLPDIQLSTHYQADLVIQLHVLCRPIPALNFEDQEGNKNCMKKSLASPVVCMPVSCCPL